MVLKLKKNKFGLSARVEEYKESEHMQRHSRSNPYQAKYSHNPTIIKLL